MWSWCALSRSTLVLVAFRLHRLVFNGSAYMHSKKYVCQPRYRFRFWCQPQLQILYLHSEPRWCIGSMLYSSRTVQRWFMAWNIVSVIQSAMLVSDTTLLFRIFKNTLRMTKLINYMSLLRVLHEVNLPRWSWARSELAIVVWASFGATEVPYFTNDWQTVYHRWCSGYLHESLLIMSAL